MNFNNMPTSKMLQTIVWIVLWLALMGCANHQPIPVGFAGELTGRRSELGVAARDGVQLAVDEINANGGINGRPIKLIIKDDKGDPETARQVDKELIDQGVVAIIGHITSAQTAAVLSQINQAEVILFSPASSSHLFSGQQDNFFRNQPSTELIGETLARHIFKNRGINQLTIVYDTDNEAFSDALRATVEQRFSELGGKSLNFAFSSTATDLQGLVTQIKASEPEAVLFIASSIDTALMAQYARQQNLDVPLFSSTWANTSELLEKGGRAVEGLEMASVYDFQSSYPPFQSFVANFNARYNREPDFLASYGYEAVLILTHALKQTQGQAKGLPQALTSIHNLAGVQGLISLDEYGDVIRDVYIVKIKEGQFEVIHTIVPQ